MDEFYLGHRIRVIVELNPNADCWIPTADVSWDERGKQAHQRLTGLNGFFAIMDEAHTYAIEMAKTWIDAQVKERFTMGDKSSAPLRATVQFANQIEGRKKAQRNQTKRKSVMLKQATVTMLLVFLALGIPVRFALSADTGKLSSGDASFIKDAAQGGMLEVELGKLAQDKAASGKVKEFGERMEQDHSKANDELKKLAADKGVQLSTALDSKHKSKIDKLAKLSGADFDKRYISDMVSDHKTTINAFQKEADKGKDADVKQFASKTLPTIKEHLQLAESTDKEVKESKSKSAGK